MLYQPTVSNSNRWILLNVPVLKLGVLHFGVYVVHHAGALIGSSISCQHGSGLNSGELNDSIARWKAFCSVEPDWLRPSRSPSSVRKKWLRRDPIWWETSPTRAWDRCMNFPPPSMAATGCRWRHLPGYRLRTEFPWNLSKERFSLRRKDTPRCQRRKWCMCCWVGSPLQGLGTVPPPRCPVLPTTWHTAASCRPPRQSWSEWQTSKSKKLTDQR